MVTQAIECASVARGIAAAIHGGMATTRKDGKAQTKRRIAMVREEIALAAGRAVDSQSHAEHAYYAGRAAGLQAALTLLCPEARDE